MKRPRLAFAAIVAAGALVTFALARLLSSEPSYGGKSAAQWLEVYRRASLAEQEDARDAFKGLGDRGVPCLLSVLTRPDRLSLARFYEKLWSKIPLSLRRILPRVSTEETGRNYARELLRAVRPSAKVLMPRLRPWLTTPEHPRYALAMDLLGTVGEGGSEAVPFLVQALGSTNRYHRIFAAQSLERFGGDARAAVPALIGALADPATRLRVIRALGNIGHAAKDALPALEAFSTRPTDARPWPRPPRCTRSDPKETACACSLRPWAIRARVWPPLAN